ncbi:MAG: peptide ABC transporter substrate-binding protein, partial [Chloroflexi bacterium CFX2]|nr:peptide ABC transporter substrate-binding protein [Chloroflexi bacterium CFX2]
MTGLVTIDETGNFVPVLAEGLPTISDDHLTVTWKLMADLKWSDGEPLTSDDVRFTIEVLSNPNS